MSAIFFSLVCDILFYFLSNSYYFVLLRHLFTSFRVFSLFILERQQQFFFYDFWSINFTALSYMLNPLNR